VLEVTSRDNVIDNKKQSSLYNIQEVWPPGSADTVCPRQPVITQVQHFVSRMKKRQRWDVHVRRSLDTDSTKTLVHTVVMSRVDYYDAVFAGSPRYITDISTTGVYW